MVEYPEVAGHDLVLQHGPGGDVYPVPVVSNDDHRAPQTHWAKIFCHRKIFLKLSKPLTSFPEGDIPGDGEMVQLQQVGHRAEPGDAE